MQEVFTGGNENAARKAGGGRHFCFFFPDSCGKVQDAPPNPFSVFFLPALSIGSAFINTTPTFEQDQ